MHRSALVVSLVLAAAGCVKVGRGGVSAAVPIPSSVLLESRSIDHAVPAREGVLTRERFAAIASSVRALRADPTSLSVDAGDTIRVADLVRIHALDSAGVSLGEIPFHDFAYTGRGFRLLTDGRVRLGRAGTVTYTARMPASLWPGDAKTRPSVQVPLLVHARP